MTIYADTNYLTRFYLDRPESEASDSLCEKHQPVFPITWLLRLELVNAFEQAVFTGMGTAGSRVSPNLAAACQEFFKEDLRLGIAMKMVELSMREVTTRFEEIALRHTARHGFRSYDILHVASALVLGCQEFWSFDQRACKLAKLEGLKLHRF